MPTLSDLANLRLEIANEYSAYRRAHHTVLRQHFDEEELECLERFITEPRTLAQWLHRQPFYRILGLVQKPVPEGDGWLSKDMPRYTFSGALIKERAGSFVNESFKNIHTGIRFRGFEGCYGIVTIKHPKVRSLNRAITMRHHDTDLMLAVAIDNVDDSIFESTVFAEIKFQLESFIMTYEDYENGQTIQVLEVRKY